MLKLLAQVVKIMLLRQLKDHPSEYNYNNVKRWTNRHFNRNLKTVTNPNLNIFEFDEVLVPMNHENSHWYLAVIYMTEKRILNYDSLQSLGIDERSVLLRFVNCCEIAADLNYCPSFLPSESLPVPSVSSVEHARHLPDTYATNQKRREVCHWTAVLGTLRRCPKMSPSRTTLSPVG